MSKSFSRIFDSLCKILFYFGGVLLFVAAFTTSYDVFMRYLFIKPTSWANDFVEYSLLYSTFLAAAWLAKNDWNIRLTVVYDLFNDRTKLILDIVSLIITLIVISSLFWFGFTDTINAYQKGILIVRPITVQKWIIMMALPIGFLMLLFVIIGNTICAIQKLRKEVSADINGGD